MEEKELEELEKKARGVETLGTRPETPATPATPATPGQMVSVATPASSFNHSLSRDPQLVWESDASMLWGWVCLFSHAPLS